MPATTKRGRPKNAALAQRRRDEILDAAAQMFAERGYAETDLQVLADALGIGKGTVYRYFPTKSDLFLAAADRGMRRLKDHIDAARATAKDPLDQLVRAISAYLSFFQQHPELVELLMLERAVFKDRRKPTYFQHREANRDYWLTLFGELIAQGAVRDIAPEHIVEFLGDLVYGSMFSNFFVGKKRPPEALARRIVDIVFHGILTDRERGRRRTATHAGGGE